MRYWAVVGLDQAVKADASLAAKALPAVEPLAKDPAASVRAAVGEALCDMGKLNAGLALLAEVATTDTGMAADLAAWALYRLGDKARPVLPKIENTDYPKERYPRDALDRVVKMLKKDGK